MRVLYFTERDTPHDRRFLTALGGTGHQVFALRLKDCDPLTPMGVTECDWPDGLPELAHWAGWQAAAKQLAALLDDLKPDLVHAGPVQGPALLTALAGFHPLVTMSWGSDLLRTAQRSPWMRSATQCTLDRTDVFLGDCQTVADAAAGFGFPREKMVLFPWGVDLQIFSPENGFELGEELREKLGWQENFVVLCNRTWAPLYGVDQLARAFVAAVQQEPQLRLLLVGDGPQAEEIHEILDPLGDKVYFAGRIEQNDLPAYLNGADLYVSPSHSDGSSISLLEAMACGRVVLVSDIPSNREWVEDGVNGRLFTDGSESDLVAKLVEMVHDPGQLDYGGFAHVTATERADWRRNFQECLRAYQLAVE